MQVAFLHLFLVNFIFVCGEFYICLWRILYLSAVNLIFVCSEFDICVNYAAGVWVNYLFVQIMQRGATKRSAIATLFHKFSPLFLFFPLQAKQNLFYKSKGWWFLLVLFVSADFPWIKTRFLFLFQGFHLQTFEHSIDLKISFFSSSL